MFARLGSFTHRRRWWVLAVSAVLTVVAGWLGPGVGDAVVGGGFDDPASESSRAATALEDAFGRTTADVVAVWSHPDWDPADPADPAYAEAITALLADLPADTTERVLHPWSPDLPAEARAGLLADDGTAMAVISLAGDDADARSAVFDRIRPALTAPEPWTTELAGDAPVSAELQHRAETDIVRAETLAMPLLLLLMAVIFGSLVAAALPVTIGAVAILGAMGLLRALTLVTDISTFALNVTTILGLGLAIDYALFMVSRFREELDRGADVPAAVRRTVATAGRTVAFSGMTVLIAFAGLLFFPQMFLRTMGLGGMAVVLLDMLLALTLLPALLAVLGRRVERGRLPRGLTARLARRRTASGGGWTRIARVVLARPGAVAVAATALLAAVALPAMDFRPGLSDIRDLPETSVARTATERLGTLLPGSDDVGIDVVVRGPVDDAALAGYVGDLGALPGATGAGVVGVAPDGTTHLRVSTDGVVDAPATRDLVAEVRDLAPPSGADDVLVGGLAAVNVDSIAAITGTLPLTLVFVAGVTMLLLFLALGSVVLPVKAVVMNALSLGATVGFLVWAFGQGNLAGALSFTETGRIDPANVVLIAIIAFGLAMDYELFLLSRIREEHLHGASTGAAITAGLQKTGRTITSAALLLVVVLAAMGTASVTFLQLVGLGLAFAVAVDATIVRALLVPATLRLLGGLSWWLPAPLARLHARFGISEADDEAAPGSAPDSHDVTDTTEVTADGAALVGAGR